MPLGEYIYGAILGSLADENLRRSIMVNEGQYLEMVIRPIGIDLMIAVIWSFYYGIRRSRRESMRLTARGAVNWSMAGTGRCDRPTS